MSTEALDPAMFSSIYEAMRAEQRGQRREVVAHASLDITEALRASPLFESDPLIYVAVKRLERGDDPARVLVEALLGEANARADAVKMARDVVSKSCSPVVVTWAHCTDVVNP